MTNVSLMTNKIELLTNSLSDPDFIGPTGNGMLIVCVCYFDIVLFILYLICSTSYK